MENLSKKQTFQQKDPLQTVKQDVPTIIQLNELKQEILKQKQMQKLKNKQRNCEIQEKIKLKNLEKQQQEEQQSILRQQKLKEEQEAQKRLKELLHQKQVEKDKKEQEIYRLQRENYTVRQKMKRDVIEQALSNQQQHYQDVKKVQYEQLAAAIRKQFDVSQQEHTQKLNITNKPPKLMQILPKIESNQDDKHETQKTVQEEIPQKQDICDVKQSIDQEEDNQLDKQIEETKRFQDQQWENMQLINKQLENKIQNQQNGQQQVENKQETAYQISDFDELNKIYVDVLQLTVNQVQTSNLQCLQQLINIFDCQQFFEQIDSIVNVLKSLICGQEIKNSIIKFIMLCQTVLRNDLKYFTNIQQMFQSILVYQ